MLKNVFALACLCVVATACSRPAETPTVPQTPEFGSFGLDLDTIDAATAPGDDFFQHVNGQWLETFEIPADKSRFGVFVALSDRSEAQVRAIIEDTAASAPADGTLEAMIANHYNAFMDVDAIEARGLAPLVPYLETIAGVETREDLARLFASTGYDAPIGGWVDVDSKQTNRYIFYITQAGLGLPDRSYYLDETERFEEIRGEYVDFLETMLAFAGYEDARGGAEAAMALETQMAQIHWDRAKRRNRDLTYNLLSREDMIALGGGFPTGLLLDEIGLGEQDEFVVRELDAVEGLMNLAQTGDLDAWRAYLAAHFVSSHAAVLPAEIDDAQFDFYGRTLRGQPEQRERWKRGVDAVEGALGEAVGKVYVDRHFPPAAKAGMESLIENLREAYAQRIDALEWMGDDTKTEARDKLAKFIAKIGYPEKFEGYDGLVVGEDALENAFAAADWAWRDMLSDLGQPIDRTSWFITPQTVNAYYAPNRNEIVFPAAILQPPFFDPAADPAVNYGAIGGVIGHEMGHGFDDQGSKSDGDGQLRNWWTEDDKSAFEARTQALVDQYSEFSPVQDLFVNGRQTLGENIGDLGGLSVAYTAYKLSLNGEEAPVIDGLTGDQRFFMSWAQVWRSLYREEATVQQLKSGVHSPPQYRVNGVVRNMDAWYDAFDVQPGDALYLPPEKRVSVW